MIYALPGLIAAMLGFMWWRSAFQLRRDRVRAVKSSDRSGLILTPKRRVRAQLMRAFKVSQDKPEWEAPLVANLAARKRSEDKS